MKLVEAAKLIKKSCERQYACPGCVFYQEYWHSCFLERSGKPKDWDFDNLNSVVRTIEVRNTFMNRDTFAEALEEVEKVFLKKGWKVDLGG